MSFGDVIVSKCSVYKMFSVYTKTITQSPLFPSFPGLKSVFKKLRFRDGLVWTVGLAVDIKLRFHISPAWRIRGPKTFTQFETELIIDLT